MGSDGLDTIAHVIQTALTPVFLLSGIGTLLNLFNTRVARVGDQLEATIARLQGLAEGPQRMRAQVRLQRLLRRRASLDVAVLLGAVAAAATCGAALVMFVGGLRDASVRSWLSVTFGVALGCTVVALVAFVVDSVLSWHSLGRRLELDPPP